MKTFLLRTVLLTMVAVGLTTAASSPASASQPEVVFVRMNVDLWPDYDRRGVLVIYRGDLAPGVGLPVTVRLSLPAAAGAPTAVAERQADGQLVNLTFERTVEGDTAVVEAQVTRPTLQFEYYDPGLRAEGARRSFEYRWPGDFEVGELTVTVQQPDLASELETSPPAASRAPGPDGLVYHTVGLGARSYGEAAGVEFSYIKEDDRLTIETVQQAMAPPPTSSSPPVESRQEILVVVLALAALAIVAAAGFVIFRRRDRDADSRDSRTKAGFCTQCGTRAAASDRFCHRCGQPLRPGERA